MSISIRTISKTMDPVTPEKTMRTLANMHQWVGGVPSPLSVLQIVKRHSDTKTVTVPFLFYNTFLMTGFTASIPVPLLPDIDLFSVGSAPALQERALEIGNTLREDEKTYGQIISALCEVWKDGEKNKLLSAWPGHEFPHVTVGADAGGITDLQHLGAGLMTIASRKFRIARSLEYVFNERGSKTSDADHFANKGILLTEINLGFNSNIEVYSTHLFNGGVSSAPPASERFPRQLKQIKELVAFFRLTHLPQNFAMITGDFNIGESPRNNFNRLINEMNSINMVDIWKSRNGNPGYTSSFVEKPGICKTNAGERRFCVDGDETARSARIDYIFMQRPQVDHKIFVDYTRPRRRPFLRSAGSVHYNEIKSMSDHLGLETTLIISPK